MVRNSRWTVACDGDMKALLVVIGTLAISCVNPSWARSVASVSSQSFSNFSISLLVPSTKDPVYKQVVEAVKLSVSDANAGALVGTGCRLEAVTSETNYSSWTALSELAVAALDQNSNVVAATGFVSSAEVRAVTPVSTAGDISIVTVGAMDYGLTRGLVPNLYRACPSDRNLATALIEMIVLFSWSEVVLLHSDAFYGESFRLEFIRLAAARSVKVGTMANIDYIGQTASANTHSLLRNVKTNGSKIIVCSLPVDHLLPVLRVAKELEMLTTGFAWIGTHLEAGVRLLSGELASLMNGMLWLRPTIDQARKLAIMSKLDAAGFNPPPNSDESLSVAAIYAYDAVSAVAKSLAACCAEVSISRPSSSPATIRLGGAAFYRSNAATCVLRKMNTLRFTSITGAGLNLDIDPHVENQQDTSYDIINVVESDERIVGKWSQQERLESYATPVVVWPGGGTEVPSGKALFRGVLRVLVPISAPFGFLPNVTYEELDTFSDVIPDYGLSNDNFSGVAVDFLHDVAQRAGFDYKLYLYPYGSWTKMVELVGNESSPWDLAIGSITVTKDRAATANFTRSIYLSGLQMLVLRPTGVTASVWAFILPLHWHLWLVLLLTLFGVSGVLLVLDRPGVSFRGDKGLPVSDAIFFSFSSFFFVHESDNVSKPMARAFLTVILFAVLILVAAYTAQLSYYLSTRKGSQSASDVSDLQFIWVGSRFGGANYPYITGELGLRKVRIVHSRSDMLTALRNKSIGAYIADIPHNEVIAATECDTMTTGRRIYTQQYSFAAKKNAVWLDEMNRAISFLLSDGVVSRLYKKYVPNECPPVASIDAIKPLTLTDLLSLVYVVAVGAALSLIAKIAHCLHQRHCQQRIGLVTPSRPAAKPDSDTNIELMRSSDMNDSGISDMLKSPLSFSNAECGASASSSSFRAHLSPSSTSTRSTMELFLNSSSGTAFGSRTLTDRPPLEYCRGSSTSASDC